MSPEGTVGINFRCMVEGFAAFKYIGIDFLILPVLLYVSAKELFNNLFANRNIQYDNGSADPSEAESY